MSSTFLSNDSTLEGFYDALNGDNATVEVSTERITFEGLTLDKQPFGLILGGNWFPGPFVSGTLGLGFEGNSFLNATPPVQQLFFSKAFKEPVFTFALSRPSITSVTSKGGYAVEAGGKFTIGEIDQTQYKGNIGWSPLISTNPKSVGPTEWAAKLDKITVNEVTLPEFEDLIAVFDTAISGTYVSDALFNTIFAQVKDSFIEGSDDPDARSDSSAYVACGDGLAPVFNLTMSMGGVSIPINPMDLIERSPQYNLDGKEFCPTTFSSMNDTKVSLILGQEVLSSLLTIFSFDPPRIGIAAQSDRINNNSNQSNGFETVQIYSTSEVTRPTSTNFTQTTLPTVFASATTHFQKVGSTTINVGGSFAGGTLSIESITMATVIPMSSNGAVPIFSKNKTYSIYILVASFHFTVIFVTVVMTL
ncbi:hypothetical protein L7F22_039061 [Adiantum nelumboides]|nr:hypothetical protein [Adiantum nelumboides]